MYSIYTLAYFSIFFLCVQSKVHEESTQSSKTLLESPAPKKYDLVFPKIEFHKNRRGKSSSKTSSSKGKKSSLHSKEKRDLEGADQNAHAEASLTFSSGNKTYIIDLTPNEHLLAPRYLEEGSAKNDGKKSEPCEFQGAIRGRDNSWAALSLCGSVSGVVWDGPETYFIEPAEVFWTHGSPTDAKAGPALKKKAQEDTGGHRNRDNPKDERPGDYEDGREVPGEMHYFFKSTDLEEASAHRCGVTRREEAAEAAAAARRTTSGKRVVAAPQDLKPGPRERSHGSTERRGTTRSVTKRAARFRLRGTIEMYIVASKGLYKKIGTQTGVKKRCHKIANIVDAIYRPLGLKVVVVGVEVWTTKDRVAILGDSGKTLTNFQPYRKELLSRGINHDNLQLLTTQDFEGSVAGKGSMSQMCRENSVGISSDRGTGLEMGIAITMAHELGHNLGLPHDNDTCSCDSNFCIMEATSKGFIGNPEVVWSDCSRDSLMVGFSKGLDSCLDDDPFDKMPNTLTPVCGNGIVEKDEQCDCGPEEFCYSNCCNGSTCQLVANATCSSGDCCDLETCRPMKAATVCRPRRNECDLPEYCNGLSESCPADLYTFDGTPCGTETYYMDEGYCIKGKCGTHHSRCQLLWGPSAVAANEDCYRKGNRGGDEYGNCGKGSNGEYKRCTKSNVKCGLVFCLPKRRMSWNGYSMMSYGDITCYAASAANNNVELGLVPDGAKCDEGKMCLGQVCQAVSAVEAKTPAEEDSRCQQEGCGGRGVCNNLNQCHCERGYAPPDCKYPGLGGSIHSGPADTSLDQVSSTILFIIFMAVVPLLALIFCIACNMRHFWETKGRQVVQSHSPCCASFCDQCCCYLLSCLTLWIVTEGPFKKKRGEMVQVDATDEGGRTICEVNLDVKPPAPTTDVMGIADERLVTVITSITPKNSPDTRRKVLLKSSSNSLHKISNESLDQQRPLYHQSISRDSGCVSDGEPDVITNTKDPLSSKMSMGSLISVFKKYQAPKSKPNGENTPDLRRSKGQGSMKVMPLSRFVVDPLTSKRSSQHGAPPTEALQPPQYRRSFSIDPAYNKNSKEPPPLPSNPPRPMKATKSEENLRHLRVQNNAFLQTDKDRPQALRPPLKKASPIVDSQERFPSSSSISNQPPPKKKVALLPPRNLRTPPTPPEIDSPDSKKTPLLPSHIKNSSSGGNTPTTEVTKRPLLPPSKRAPSSNPDVPSPSAPSARSNVKNLSSKFGGKL
ncbi:disintegrin and metalloproteinase domain-containing protein 28-like [Oratosquilla oratoria]|uniref:disintegrin and metalloproteinase domain-containing protein 28-like n=1 Tax=Oratosquilla oratoria TaxID=337810 RepID=UPI003F760AB0